MTQDPVSYQADGLQMRGTLVYEPASSPRPGVLVFPEAFGPGEHSLGRAERLAQMGFVALSCDLHGEGRYIDDVGEAVGLLDPLYADPTRIRARAGAALELLRGRPEVDASRVAAIGFCFGGTMALELAREGADIRAAVAFHGGLASRMPAAKGAVKARVLACIGADDPWIDPDQRATFEKEMRDAAASWALHLYGNTVHGFTNPHAARRNMPEAIRYNPEADAASWGAMGQLFVETLTT
ncbi:dienelactone hydrolase family protein [Rhizosaccharibacter radicis]|uniref:Dienelactone hydrolase family protein n=1 Tax=Rhizosaccharibacter radicis TaxID=2782605 RepID=A0ABT1VX22_9PROT|nr:dienelactone hydrolase family protein [Acetobacteraceae bacterium KSS12]